MTILFDHYFYGQERLFWGDSCLRVKTIEREDGTTTTQCDLFREDYDARNELLHAAKVSMIFTVLNVTTYIVKKSLMKKTLKQGIVSQAFQEMTGNSTWLPFKEQLRT